LHNPADHLTCVRIVFFMGKAKQSMSGLILWGNLVSRLHRRVPPGELDQVNAQVDTLYQIQKERYSLKKIGSSTSEKRRIYAQAPGWG
jgi:hypothetical protein